ncbi:cellulose synthase/poly-beta-1,6-N-acetylglucosamine synthase-like glycosyltransferase [Winogradskyella epiphytica]|uniref:Cellulose synthase/poly-beta-1,6-N-acetylglucosamine synthase-like glycosyltransferase n=1 Tax=Winogradskyella epiphytica TaxID=262005 RepID=A0A2V4XA90_9FLAO|nr:glycosyltransferase [Winogradskyella epiphytica]PYE82975.1 cellulose synthase/poly-beta-1,6-N-acetylglucosamine synthase-like glycosyltransferase [Winogradskyella epiphytica]GGW54933.1 glycosyl transferase [Winogradskyella epiphytica]
MLSIFIIVTISAYAILIGLFIYGFDKVEDFKVQAVSPKTKFSIIIPFRNEAENLPDLLDSIGQLNYPKDLFEVLLVDDESEDNSVSIIQDFIDTSHFKQNGNQFNTFSIIKNNRKTDSPKKDAISSAIRHSKFDWIITTDADCILPKNWLITFDAFIQKKDTNCIVAPVSYHGSSSFLDRFQTLDFLSLQGATMGGFGIKKPFMCNGANFAYRKALFISVHGFEGNNTIASGDDLFLLEKFIELDSNKVHYLKSEESIVTTRPASSFKHLIQQRLRWASKTSNYKDWFAKLVGVVVLFGNLVCLGLIPAVYFNLIGLKIALVVILIKVIVDFLLLYKSSHIFKQEKLLSSYLFSAILYPFFSVSIAFLSFFTSYQWKGRKFKK